MRISSWKALTLRSVFEGNLSSWRRMLLAMLEALLVGVEVEVELKCASECETRDAVTSSHKRCQGVFVGLIGYACVASRRTEGKIHDFALRPNWFHHKEIQNTEELERR